MKFLEKLFGRKSQPRLETSPMTPEVAENIVQDYGAFLASSPVTAGCVADVAKLPHSKGQIIKSYRDLPQEQQTLCSEEEKLLVDANSIYVAKEFEYLNVFDATTAYKRFPSLTNLETLTRKIINYAA